MRIDIEDIRQMQVFRDKVNGVHLDNIEFFENGDIVQIGLRRRLEFLTTGLNNIDFITSGAYKGH